MCTPQIIREATAGISRRDALSLGLTTAALALNRESAPKTLNLTRLVDLTHTLTPRFPVIPIPGLTFPFEIKPVATLEKNGVYANEWRLIEHTGTHIDAPSHFIAEAHNLEKFTPQDLIVPIAVVDVREKAARNPDYAVTIDDLRAWEKQHGRLPRNAGVFMNSAWESKLPDAKAFLGTDASGTMHFPGFSPEVCNFLIHEREIAGVGVDTISFDIGADNEYHAHKALFRGGKWGIENIANLSQIPPVGATALIGALKVEGASGGPIRLVAAW